MTRKDYIRIERGINSIYKAQDKPMDAILVADVADAIAAELAADNPLFDWERFADAGMKEGE